MSELKELLEREARRVDADPGALESVFRTKERRQRDRRIGTAIFAFAIFAAVIALISGALGSDRSFPADRTPGPLPHNGDIVVRAIIGNDKGAILQIDPATSKEVALPVAASAKDLVWPVMGSQKNMTDRPLILARRYCRGLCLVQRRVGPGYRGRGIQEDREPVWPDVHGGVVPRRLDYRVHAWRYPRAGQPSRQWEKDHHDVPRHQRPRVVFGWSADRLPCTWPALHDR